MKAKKLPGSLSEETLRSLWRASRDSRSGSAGSPGVDKISAIDFGKDLKGQIHRIREAIRHGYFAFKPLRVVPIPKKNGSTRLIAIPPVGDRLVQRALCSHLASDARFPKTPKVAYGFVPGRKLRDAHLEAIALRNEAPWVLQTDIISFFDEIPRADVEAAIAKSVRSKVVRNLLTKAIQTELDYSDPFTTKLAKENGIKAGRGLRQGMPLSPLLSNLVMRSVDHGLVAEKRRAIRYADDIAIFCSSRTECIEAFECVANLLKPLGLRLPSIEADSKTVIIPPDEACEFLGVEVRRTNGGYSLCVPRGRAELVEYQLFKISTLEYCVQQKVGLSRMLSHYDAVIRGHKETAKSLEGADAYFSRLDAARSRAQRSLLISILGKGAVDNLTEAKRAVLGLNAFPN